MKTMTIGEFKAHFAEVAEQVKSGIGVAVTYGRKKEIVGYFLPKSGRPKNKRKLGLMQGKPVPYLNLILRSLKKM